MRSDMHLHHDRRARPGQRMKVGCGYMMHAASAVMGCTICVHAPTHTQEYAVRQEHDYVLHVGFLPLGQGTKNPDHGHYVASTPLSDSASHDRVSDLAPVCTGDHAINAAASVSGVPGDNDVMSDRAAASTLLNLQAQASWLDGMSRCAGDLHAHTAELPPAFHRLRGNDKLRFDGKRRHMLQPPASGHVTMRQIRGIQCGGQQQLTERSRSARAPFPGHLGRVLQGRQTSDDTLLQQPRHEMQTRPPQSEIPTTVMRRNSPWMANARQLQPRAAVAAVARPQR